MALASLIQSVQTAFGASADQVGREDIEIPNAVPSTDQKVKNIKSTTKPPPTGKVSPTSTLDGTRKSARRTSDVSHHSSDATDSEEETNAIANTNGNASAAANTRFCVHLTPTRQEFSRPFAEYMTAFFKKNPDCPCVRVTPPAGYKPRRKQLQEKDMESLQINAPIKQHVFGRSGAYMAVLEEQKAMTAAQYKAIATKKDRQPPTRGQSGVREERDREMERGQGRQRQEQQQDLMERSFWSGVTLNPPIYGADTVMSLFDEKVSWGWNLRNLGCLWKEYNVPQIGGVTTPMTYFGMWKAFFAWHKEDLDLYSINYLHAGAPKVWYCVPPSESDKFDAMARQLFPELAADCGQFMRHKNVLISPSLLRTFNVNYVQAVQQPGDFIVVNAQAYHSGYNLGYNTAEAVNFALEDWLEIGRDCEQCRCGALDEGVCLDMSIFFPGLYSSEEEEDSEASDSEEEGDEDASSSDSEGEEEEEDEEDEEDGNEEEDVEIDDEVLPTVAHNKGKKRPRQTPASKAPKKASSRQNRRAHLAAYLPPPNPSNLPISLPREACHVTWGAVVDPKPMALVPAGGDQGTMTLVHRLERPASRADSAWFGVLEMDQDGLYVPKGDTILVQFGGPNSPKLVDVRLQWTCPETRRRGAWKLRRGAGGRGGRGGGVPANKRKLS